MKLSLADYVIAHSEAMRAWLIEHGFRKPVGVLGLFDFLSDSKPASRTKAPEKPYKVMYVGDLSYSYNAALYEMGQNAANWTTVLYGGGFELEKATPGCRIDYRGYINSDDLIAAPDADFGLVWYGSSRHGCEGRIGDYLRYIAAHKLSLYLRCEVPVIVGKGTAMAEFVEREGIGITVDSLDNIEGLLGKLSPEQYMQMKERAAAVGRKLAQGAFTSAALAEAGKALAAK